jgi:hypothetical protein
MEPLSAFEWFLVITGVIGLAFGLFVKSETKKIQREQEEKRNRKAQQAHV